MAPVVEDSLTTTVYSSMEGKERGRGEGGCDRGEEGGGGGQGIEGGGRRGGIKQH